MKTIASLLLFGALMLAGCKNVAAPKPTVEIVGQTVNISGGSYTNINVDELQSMLANKNFTFVNVHIPFEGNIAKTDLSIPYNEIEQNLGKLPIKTPK